jgi:UDP-N-acetylglucosamine 2-epimerase (non-hydrolysing)
VRNARPTVRPEWPTRPDLYRGPSAESSAKPPELHVAAAPVERPRVCLVGGTRPEGLKLGPVAAAMREEGRIDPLIVASGQHPTMFHQAMDVFDMRPDITVRPARRQGGQAELASLLLAELDQVLADCQPQAVVVQGDTTTTLAAALAAFWRGIPVVHLEAGLRSGDLSAPFPEEGNRKLVGQISSLHLAPTPAAARNLELDGIAGPGVLTIGNTIIDAALALSRVRVEYSHSALSDAESRAAAGDRRLVLVTVHRRESWGEPLQRVLRAVADLVRSVPDIEVVVPAHPNPLVRDQVVDVLGDLDRVTVTDPLPYVDLVRLLRCAALVLSDSGGIQEEVGSFGVPVLVLREVTERKEAVQAGIARLVGTDGDLVQKTATQVLEETATQVGGRPCPDNPFGDGKARYRAEQAIAWHLGVLAAPPEPFAPRIVPDELKEADSA